MALRRVVLLLAGLCLIVDVAARGAIDTTAAFSGTAANSANTFQAAASFCSAPGPVTVAADGDSWADELVPLLNHGTEASLFVRSGILQDRRTLVSFPLPPIPARCSVTLATLRLFAKSAQGTRTLEAYRAAGPWTETGVTWSNQPGTSGSPSTTSSGTGWREWTVTTQVLNMYAAANHGFLLKDSIENEVASVTQDFSSREDTANHPELVITFG